MEHIGCIFCDGATTSPYKVENGYQSVCCDRCGLVFVTPRPTIDEMKQLYDGQETKVSLSDHLNRRGFKSVEARRCLGFITPFVSKGRLLEVGSAAGYFLNEARALGFDVQGLDITHPFVRFCEDVLGIPAVEGTLKDARFADASFDVVYMRNVLSHLAYPIDEFRTVWRLLKPGGILVLETGNVAELPAERAGELELPDHLYHFSEKTIALLFERTGFHVERIERFTLLTQMRAYRRLLGKKKGPGSIGTGPKPRAEAPLPTTLPPSKLAQRLESHVAQFVRYDLGRLLANPVERSTLVAVGRKPFASA